MSHQSPPPPSLVMRKGPHPNRPFPLGKDVITIGRSPDNDIVVDNAGVSRYHARLTRRGNGWVLEDLGSRNGTFVNGQRITGPVMLTPGTQVDFGPDVSFGVEGGMPPPEAIPARPPPAYAPRPSRPAWLLWTLGGAVVVVFALIVAAIAGYFFLRPSAPESITGLAPATPGPDVVLQEPTTGTLVDLGDAVMVFALARDEVGVTRTELWVNDQFVAQQDSPTPAGITPLSLVYSWVAATPGTQALLVRAFNSQGAMGMSPVVYVTVSGEPATEPPVAQYLVQPGDTLTSVAKMMSTTVPAIQQQNPAISKTITAGQTIVVPVPTLTPTVQAPAQPGAVVTSVQPAQPPALPPGPPNAPLKAPNLLSATPKDCSVTLVWQDNSDNELGFLVYRGVQGAPGFTLLPKAEPAKAGTGSQVQYVDKVPRPDTYIYYVEAANAGGKAASNLRTVTVPPTAACIQPAGFKQVVFQPLTVKVKNPVNQTLSLYFTIADLAYQRIPTAQGTGLSPGDWSAHKQAAPVPASVYLEPGSPVLLSVRANAHSGPLPPKDLGRFLQQRPQSELLPTNSWSGGTGDFDLTYRLWLENVTWGKGSTANIPPPTNLRLATSVAELDKIATCKPGKCDPKAIRALVWDWSGDPKTIDGYILYRFYSCPGKDAQIVAPEVIYKARGQGKAVPAWTVPSGCAARYQVSAFGPAGESEPSKPLDVPAGAPIAKVQVTFKKLTFKQPPKKPSGAIRLQANQYDLQSNLFTFQSQTYDLDKVTLDGKMPNNVLLVNLGGGDSLQLTFYESTSLICKGELLFPKPANNDWGPLAGSYTLQDNNCAVTVEIGKPTALPAGQVAKRQANLHLVAQPKSTVGAIGKDVYVPIWNSGPDALATNQVKLTSYWIDPVTNQPVNKQTILRWVNIEVYTEQLVQVDSIPPNFVNLKPLPKFHVELAPVDFDDPYSGNNVWEGIPKSQ